MFIILTAISTNFSKKFFEILIHFKTPSNVGQATVQCNPGKDKKCQKFVNPITPETIFVQL